MPLKFRFLDRYSLDATALIFSVLVMALFGARAAQAELAVSKIFTDHAVLQRDVPVPVWGRADAQAAVTVSFADQTKKTRADENGKWRVTLDPLAGSSDPRKLIIGNGGELLVLTNIVVGEVWICSGQSNMQKSVKSVRDVKALVPKMKHVRSFQVKRTVAFDEQENVEGTWKQKRPDSAVACSFAHFLQQKADVPVGIILTCWGSSSLEAWMPRDMVDTVPHFQSMMEDFDNDTNTRDQIQGILDGEKPWSRKDDVFLRRQTNILYNAMMHPLAPYSCRGLVWYQGERNTQSMNSGVKEPWYGNHSGILKYGDTLKKWIQRYRKQWKNDQMQFLIVMLPGYGKVLPSKQIDGTATENKIADAKPDKAQLEKTRRLNAEHPDVHSWAWMRESQLQALELPRTGVVNTIDLGDIKNIHPNDKLPIGQRIALLAARDTLGQDVVAEGPVMSHVEELDSKLVVHFANAEGLKTLDGKLPTGFWVCKDSEKWVRAEAHIDGQTVVLTSSEIKQPRFVRYAFAGKPTVNLVNSADLPVRPFRSDSFEP